MNIFTDFHHNSLLRSFVLLFEDRLGANVYRPIGMDWFYNGYWAINDLEDTAKQFLDIETTVLADKTPALNVVDNTQDQVHHVYDPGLESTHKAITLDRFKEIDFDYVIASIPQHIPLYQDLISKYQPRAKLIVHVGNNWSESFVSGHNVLASIKERGWSSVNAVYYHQEFDLSIFKPYKYYGVSKVSSYINVLQNMPQGHLDFNILEKELQGQVIFKSYGGQCRDGNFAGPKLLADSMRQNDLIFHVKDGGDGYGHILYNAYACGKPVITRSSFYKDCLGEELFNKNNFIDLDVMSHADAAQTVANLITNRDLLDDMSENAYRSFANAVDFQHDANKVGEWMFNL